MVTKAQVLLWLGAVVSATAVAGWALLTDHAGRIHKGAVHEQHFERYIHEQIEFRKEVRDSQKETNRILIDILTEHRKGN